MKILTGGCSFTAHTSIDKLAWPNHLASKGIEVLNTAEMGSGNQIICDRLSWALSKGGFDTVIVMWSSPYRFEVLVNRELSDYDNISKDMEAHSSYYTNFFLTGGKNVHPDSNWVRVGGGFGLWKFKSKSLNNRIESYITNNFNFEYQFLQSCKSIVTLQLLCKSLGVRLINTCWQNIWDDLYIKKKNIIGSNWLRESTFNQLKEGKLEYRPVIDQYPNARHWYDLIDWDTWIFYEKDKVVRGGLGEFAVIENNDILDNSHPNTESQKMWAEYIFNKSFHIL